MSSLLLKIIMGSIFYVLIEFYHRYDGLEVDFYKVMPYELVCLVGMLFLEVNAYLLYCVLVFHTYTDECTRTAYVVPTVLAGAIEMIILCSNGRLMIVLIELVVCMLVVHMMSFFKAFAAGDAYYLNVLLIGACNMGISAYVALFVIFYVACISFVVRMVIVNIVSRIRGKGWQRRSAFMGSILCGYLVFCWGYL